MPTISAPRLLVDGRLAGPGTVVVEHGVIVGVLDGVPPSGKGHRRLDRGTLTPGLIDVQHNGCVGVDEVHATPEEWRTVADALAVRGVTAFQPSFVTAPIAEQLAGLPNARWARDAFATEPTAQILGVHLEGPFLSPKRRGMHAERYLLHPAPRWLDELFAFPEAKEMIRTVTLAPELPGGMEAIRRLAGQGVIVAIGHSDATAEQAREAVDAGATMVTHVFNAQSPLSHRAPGIPGAALTDPRLFVGLIADLHHVDAIVCALVLAAAPDRVCLVSDAMAAAGMPPGSYRFGGQEIRVGEDGLPRLADGRIAGSGIFLDDAVRNLVRAGNDPARVLTAATANPARLMGRQDMGRIAVGCRADLVWWSDRLTALCTWVGGVEVQPA